MKNECGYRFNIQFPARSDEEVRAGEFLNSLGRRKSMVIVAAINEYLNNHPVSDDKAKQIRVNTFSLEQLEEKIRMVIEEKFSSFGTPGARSEPVLSHPEDANQDIVDMLNDLDLFNF